MKRRELFRAKLRKCFAELQEQMAEILLANDLDLDESVAVYTAGSWFPKRLTRREWMECAVELIRATEWRQIVGLEETVGLSQRFAICAAVMYSDLADDFPDVTWNNSVAIEACRPKLQQMLENPVNRALAMQSLEYYCDMCDHGTKDFTLGLFDAVEMLVTDVEQLEGELARQKG